MTHKNSICVRCKNLYSYNCFVISKNGAMSLISECCYGGKNAGNRKTCKCFVPASDDVISRRIALFETTERRKR